MYSYYTKQGATGIRASHTSNHAFEIRKKGVSKAIDVANTLFYANYTYFDICTVYSAVSGQQPN